MIVVFITEDSYILIVYATDLTLLFDYCNEPGALGYVSLYRFDIATR
jgi:hypothetical protein